jgi:hypothetical protein
MRGPYLTTRFDAVVGYFVGEFVNKYVHCVK